MKYNHLSNSLYLSKLALYLGLSLSVVGTIPNGFAAKSNTPVEAEISKTQIKDNEKEVVPKTVSAKLSRNEQIKNAVDDLAQRLNIKTSEIMPLSASQVTWRSGAMGCPKTGEMYTQALTSGLLIILGADGKHYRYHGSVHGMPSYCPANRAEAPASSKSDI
ncbi:MAG: hypothetical protein ACJAQ6_000937 [Arenicella sp.]|jgi:hypothetical protein